MSSICIKELFHLENNQDFSTGKNSVCNAANFCRDSGAAHLLKNLYCEGYVGKDDN